MPLSPVQVLFVGFGLLIANVNCDEDAAAAAAAGAIPPPVGPAGIPPPGIGGFPGGFPGGFGGLGLGGLGAGFHKNIDFNAGAGFGPFLPGLGGFGGGVPPPVPVDGAIPDPGLLGAGGFAPYGLIGPSYIPSTWIGSALGAKGDLLFPLVLFVFFVVGLWTVVKFLLALIVPLIAAKFAVLDGITHRARREVSPQEERNEQIDHLTNVVMAAFENVNCIEVMVCHTGNFMNSLAGDRIKQIESTVDALKAMNPSLMKIFDKAASTGKEDCSKYTCKGMPEAAGSSQQHVNPDNHVN